MSFFYNQLLRLYMTTSGIKKLAIRAILEIIIRFIGSIINPEVKVKLRGRELYVPLSHRLPMYLAAYPYYDSLPTRLSGFLRNKYGYLSAIDVGANIGDTICACHDNKNDKFLAIEANPGFKKYLGKNCRKVECYKLLEVYCASQDSGRKTEVRIDQRRGTATITDHSGGYKIDKKSLDTIIDGNPEYQDFNMLKIDTDGCDFQVIQGAKKWIENNKPAVLFECDVFGNENYVQDFVSAIDVFKQAGYIQAIVYDNFGYVFDIIDLNKIDDFKHALIYQLISKFYFFDILVMKNSDISQFFDSEISCFINGMSDKTLQQAATAAAKL